MESFLEITKDIVLLLSPIIVAVISYKSNKKTKKEIQLEVEKIALEKNIETKQILDKINAELESQKQLATWNNSLPQTDEYTKLAGTERYGNICSLQMLVQTVTYRLDMGYYTNEDLQELKNMMNRIYLPSGEEQLFPYEIPHIVEYKKVQRRIDELLNENVNSNQ